MTEIHDSDTPYDFPDEWRPIAPDFEPLYRLEPVHYNAIVNGFFNLTARTIQRLLVLDNPQAAQQVAEDAHHILLGYDDDLAELIRQQARVPVR